MQRNMYVMLAVVLSLAGCTPAGKESAESSVPGFKTVQNLGEAFFSAVQSKDPDKVLATYVDFEAFAGLKKAMIESVDDPLQKIKIEKAFDEDLSREKWDKHQARVYDKILQFLMAIDDGKRDVSFEAIKQGAFLGLAPLRISREKFSKRFGVDGKKLGYNASDLAILFFEHEGLVFEIRIDALIRVNHRWYLAGDYLSISLIRSKSDLYSESMDQLNSEAKKVYQSVGKHLEKMSSRDYSAKVEKYLTTVGSKGRRPVTVPGDLGNTTQSY